MEAKLVDSLPDEDGWQFEPKWDGFRCLARVSGDDVVLRSRSGKPLGRYFPDVVALLRRARLPRPCLLDGELVIPVGGSLSFRALQDRLHPAASRVAKLAAANPAEYVLFDCLEASGRSLIDEPLRERRRALERLHADVDVPELRLSPASLDPDQARRWLEASGGALDGIVAKRLDEPYRPGERAMLKLKQHREADCVVGGFRADADGTVASLLLGLYDAAGRLDHVGFTSALSEAERRDITPRLQALAGGDGFTGNAPGGPSRWSRDREGAWVPVRPELVVEVLYDQVTAGRFRHGTRLLRWRPDKSPEACTCDQIVREIGPKAVNAIARG